MQYLPSIMCWPTPKIEVFVLTMLGCCKWCWGKTQQPKWLTSMMQKYSSLFSKHRVRRRKGLFWRYWSSWWMWEGIGLNVQLMHCVRAWKGYQGMGHFLGWCIMRSCVRYGGIRKVGTWWSIIWSLCLILLKISCHSCPFKDNKHSKYFSHT